MVAINSQLTTLQTRYHITMFNLRSAVKSGVQVNISQPANNLSNFTCLLLRQSTPLASLGNVA